MDPALPPCPDLDAVAAEAWAAFRDAEVEQARDRTEAALAARACQARPVAHDVLLDLYRLDALLALSGGDQDGLVAATLRAVTAGPDEPPPPRFGTELAAAWTTWATRLGPVRATVAVQGGGTAWVDGLAVTAGAPRPFVQGEHLVQVVGPDGTLLAVRLVDLADDVILPTPGDGPLAVVVPAPAPLPAPAPPPAPPDPRRHHPAWAFLLAAGGAALAGGATGYASWLDSDCRTGAADPIACADVHPYVVGWYGVGAAGGAIALTGVTIGAAGLPAKGR